MITVDGDDRRAFGDPVSVEHGNAPCVKVVDDVLIKKGAAADHVLQIAAKLVDYFFEDLSSEIDIEL